MQIIPLAELSLVFIPTVFVLIIMFRWKLKAWTALYANVRMVIQLLSVGYLLNYVFETTQPILVVSLVAMMIGVSAWITLRSVEVRGTKPYFIVAAALSLPGLAVLALVSQLVLDMPLWFEPRLVVPIAGMIFANSMNTVSLSAERFDAELARGAEHSAARRRALEAALIPQINGLFAVGLVALPGMMTGQILSGIDPLVAVRYQIMVMWMIFGSGGLSAVIYLLLHGRTTQIAR